MVSKTMKLGPSRGPHSLNCGKCGTLKTNLPAVEGDIHWTIFICPKCCGDLIDKADKMTVPQFISEVKGRFRR